MNFLVVLVPLYILVRLFYLTFLHPYYYTLGGGEEPYVGMIGLEILKGPHFPLHEYLISDYQPGSFIVALLSAPFYVLLGPTSFATKIVSALLSLGAMVFWVRLIQKYVNARAALFFGLIFAFSPPGFTQFSITALGYHSESIFFSAACLYFLFNIICQPSESKEMWRSYAFLGFFAGLGLCFAMIFGVTLLAILIFWFLKDKGFFLKRNFRVLPLFFLIGFLPWFAFNIPNQFSGFDVYQKPIWEHFTLHNLVLSVTQFKSSVLFHFPVSFASPFWGMAPGIKKMAGIPYAFFFLAATSFALFFLIRKKEKQLLIQFSLLFGALFLLIVQGGGFFSPRYMIPLHPIVFFLSAFGCDAILRHCERGACSPVFLREASSNLFNLPVGLFTMALISLFLFTHQFVLTSEYRGRIFSTKGYAYQWIDDTVCEKIDLCLETYPELQKNLSKEDLNDFSSEFARKVADSLEGENLLGELRELALKLPKGFDRYFYYFLGRRMALENDTYQVALQKIEVVKSVSLKGHKLAALGVFDVAVIVHQESNLAALSKETVDYYWRAVGIESAAIWDIEDASDPQFQRLLKKELAGLPESSKAPFLEGVGRFFHYRWRSFEDAPHFDHFNLESLPLEYQPHVFRGVGRAFSEKAFEWQIADKSWYFEIFIKDLKDDNIREIKRGQEAVLEPLIR